jgi:hypothetical protein
MRQSQAKAAARVEPARRPAQGRYSLGVGAGDTGGRVDRLLAVAVQSPQAISHGPTLGREVALGAGGSGRAAWHHDWGP